MADRDEPNVPSGWLGTKRAQRHRRIVAAASFAYVPAAVLTVMRGDAEPPWSVFGIARAVQLVTAYVAGRACRAPFPFNGALVLLLVSSMIGMGVFLGAGAAMWPRPFAESFLGILARSACAIASVVVGAVVSGSASASAASSEGVDVS